MGSKSKSKKKRHREEEDDDEDDSTTPSSSSTYSSESDSEEIERSSKRRKSSSLKRRRSGRCDDERRRREKRRREKEKRHSRRKERRKHSSSSKKLKRDGKKRYSDLESGSGSGFESDGSGREERPEEVVKRILQKFPGVAGDLEQLLQMIDHGQAVDIKGLSEKSLVRHLRKLFLALNLKESGDKVFLLPPKVRPTLAVIQPIIRSLEQSRTEQLDHTTQQHESALPDLECKQERDGTTTSDVKEDAPAPPVPAPRRRAIGPEMPSAELLAAAAKLTEAEAQLREAELDEDSEYFIGPPPPAVVSEAQSANEAERFEEVTRIIGAEVDSPYDILGVNKNMADENMKKRYWKLSLMVHPDKCSHPQAHQAFIKLNKAFKDLQDPDKRKAMDEKIKLKEQEEEFKAELRAMREAAQWRRLQGISMEGDDILLAEMNAEEGRKRDEWMTSLPPERKPGGMPTHSKTFSKGTKEGRGDTSAWTDTPLDRAEKAKVNYLEAYNQATALASKEQDTKKSNAEAELVDQYNKAKRSKTLVEQHKESAASRSRTKKKSKKEMTKEEWEGNHPWKPWDREKDLTAGRQNVKFDSESMVQGLTSRFSSGNFQRNFL